MDDDDKLRRGQRARELLHDPIMLEVFEALRERYIKEMLAADLAELGMRRQQIRALDDTRKELRKLVTDGNFVEQKKPAAEES